MKRIALSIAALAMVSAWNAPANASDLSVFLRRLTHGGHHGACDRHQRHHDELARRAYYREVEHHAAHRYPMTYREHANVHHQLGHEAFHDRLEHRSAHQADPKASLFETRVSVSERPSYSRSAHQIPAYSRYRGQHQAPR